MFYLAVNDELYSRAVAQDLATVPGFAGMSTKQIGAVDFVVFHSSYSICCFARGAVSRAEWDAFVAENHLVHFDGGDAMNVLVEKVPELVGNLQFLSDDDFVVGKGADEESVIHGAFSTLSGDFVLRAITQKPLKAWNKARVAKDG